MRVTIEDRNDDGRGRGRVGSKIVLVSQAHPGETVTMKVDRTTRGTVQGRVARVEVADPARIEHPCDHAFHCTGCPLLAAAPADEAAFKQARVATAVEAIAGAPVPGEVRRPGGPFGWRHFAKQVVVRPKARAVLGSYVAGTHQVTDNRGCPVLAPPLADVLSAVGNLADAREVPVADPASERSGLRHVVARCSRASGEVLVGLVTSEETVDAVRGMAEALHEAEPSVAGVHVLLDAGGNAILAGDVVHCAGLETISEVVLGHRHDVGIKTFFQVNPDAAETLFRVAMEAAGTGARVVEGHSGIGALTWPLSERFEQVVAIERAPDSARTLATGAARYPNVAVVEDDVGACLKAQLSAAPTDVVVFDPPRRGLDEATIAALAAAGPGRVVLLSCDPSTLARDLPRLAAVGYGVGDITPIDQFPRTAHVETVTRLDREMTA